MDTKQVENMDELVTQNNGISPQTREIIFYKTDSGDVKVEILLQNENLWLTQAKIAELFDVDRTVITKHLKNIFEEKELDENSVCANFAHTASDGKNYKTKFYNLDAIIAVGYRVNSKKATQFRIWEVDTEAPFYFKDGRELWIHFPNANVCSTFIKNYLVNEFKNNYLKYASGTTFAELKIFSLKSILVKLPIIEEQTEIVRILDSVLEKETKEKEAAFFLTLNLRTLLYTIKSSVMLRFIWVVFCLLLFYGLFFSDNME